MATALKRYNGGRGLIFVMDAFAEMPGDVSRICDITAHDLARIHVSYYSSDAKRTKGMYKQRIQKAWGHTAHRDWARLFLDHAHSRPGAPRRQWRGNGNAQERPGRPLLLLFRSDPPR